MTTTFDSHLRFVGRFGGIANVQRQLIPKVHLRRQELRALTSYLKRNNGLTYVI